MIHAGIFQELNAAKKEQIDMEGKWGGFNQIKNGDWYAYRSHARARFANKIGIMDVHILWPSQGKLMIADYPDTMSEGKRRNTLSIASEGDEALYFTAIEPHEGDSVIEKAEALAEKNSLRIQLKDGRVHIVKIKGVSSEAKEPSMELNLTEKKNGEVLRTEKADELFDANTEAWWKE